MDKERFLLLIPLLWYFYCHPRELYNMRILLIQFYNLLIDIKNFLITDIKVEDDNEDKNKDTPEDNNSNKLEPRYEDKYLLEIRKMNKEFDFDEEEQGLRNKKYNSFVFQILSTYEDKIRVSESEMNDIEKKYTRYNVSDEEFTQIIEEENENEDEEWNDTYNKYTNCSDRKNDIPSTLTLQKSNLSKEVEKINKIIETEEGKKNILKEAEEQSLNFIINNRLDKLNSCYVMETTPQGNVLMIYDNKRNTFKYYSDNSIPYRYLEPVARKYVKLFNCRPIFVDMEEELRLAEEKWEKERKEKEEKEEEEERKKKEHENNPHIKKEEKKNVFAKFKSYNKDGASGKVNMVAPPKNSIPMTKEQENEKILLKEKANRYTYEGKMANFSFLKKVERKVVDKKYGLTFADFKRMNHKK